MTPYITKESFAQNPYGRMYPLTEIRARGILNANENSDGAFQSHSRATERLQHH